MAVLTPTSTNVISMGNKIAVQGRFSAIGNGDTWSPGLQTVDYVVITAAGSGQTFGSTSSAGVVTVAASGALGAGAIVAVGS